MIDPELVPSVEPHEKLARYIVFRNHLRLEKGTIKPDAFIPHPYSDLSVTRHLQATEIELWAVGKTVAEARGKSLQGRGDILASDCHLQKLETDSDPVEGNPNHVVITEWPSEKRQQKTIAQQLAAVAKLSFPPRRL